MFNIIKTPLNYVTRELLHDSNVAFHCKKSLVAILGGKLFGEVFCRPITGPVVAWMWNIGTTATLMVCHSQLVLYIFMFAAAVTA